VLAREAELDEREARLDDRDRRLTAAEDELVEMRRRLRADEARLNTTLDSHAS
jgi:uncharacterized protein involved in exopolysaccharide biosynthesis